MYEMSVINRRKKVLRCIALCSALFQCALGTTPASTTTTTSAVDQVITNAMHDSSELADIVADSVWSQPARLLWPKSVAEQRNRLVIVLPDKDATTEDYVRFELMCAPYGLHVIVLPYPNDRNPSELCVKDERGGCITKMMEEIVRGLPKSSIVDPDIGPDECIEGRIKAALLRVVAAPTTYGTGWVQYFTNGNIQWGKITIVGVGVGASFATYIARSHALERVVLIGGPADNYEDGSKVNYFTQESDSGNSTESNAYYALFHKSESGECSIVSKNLDTLGVVGEPLRYVEEVKGEPDTIPDFSSNVRKLCTDMAPSGPQAVSGLIADADTSLYTDSSAKLLRAWTYLVVDADPLVSFSSSGDLGDCACVSSGLSTVEIVIVAVASVLVVTTLIIICVYLFIKRKRKDEY